MHVLPLNFGLRGTQHASGSNASSEHTFDLTPRTLTLKAKKKRWS